MSIYTSNSGAIFMQNFNLANFGNIGQKLGKVTWSKGDCKGLPEHFFGSIFVSDNVTIITKEIHHIIEEKLPHKSKCYIMRGRNDPWFDYLVLTNQAETISIDVFWSGKTFL